MNNKKWVAKDFETDADGMPTLKIWYFHGQCGREWEVIKNKIAFLRKHHTRSNLHINFIPQIRSWSIRDNNFIFEEFKNLEEIIKAINLAYSLAKYKKKITT